MVLASFGKCTLLIFTPKRILGTHLGHTVMGILWIVHSSQPGLSLYSSLPRAFGTAYFAISLSTNIVMTALIVSRLVAYRRKHLAYLSSEHTQHYLSIATLVIESAALYSAFAVTFLVSYALDAPINQVWLAFGQAAQVCPSHRSGSISRRYRV